MHMGKPGFVVLTEVTQAGEKPIHLNSGLIMSFEENMKRKEFAIVTMANGGLYEHIKETPEEIANLIVEANLSM